MKGKRRKELWREEYEEEEYMTSKERSFIEEYCRLRENGFISEQEFLDLIKELSVKDSKKKSFREDIVEKGD
jgi:hypothetical protein